MSTGGQAHGDVLVDNSFAAVDLGASSGRVLHGVITDEEVTVRGVHRFANEPLRLPDGLHWNIGQLYARICAGLAAAGPVRSAGIDSWAVDYGLLDGDGALLGLPYHYRDQRTARVRGSGPDTRALFRRSGIADQPFNSIHQLRAEPEHRIAAAEHLLLIPDLLGYWFTGQMGTERTNASTTGLYSIGDGSWDYPLIGKLGLPHRIFAPISDPGTVVGELRADARAAIGGNDLHLVRVASHDTASAVAAIPAERGESFAYISSGTWSLVGLELPIPLLSDAARTAGFTNETGVSGIRYLRNVMGLWLLQEFLREWPGLDAATLARHAAEVPALTTVIDVDDPIYLTAGMPGPGSMTVRIGAHCDGPRPSTPAEYARCIFDSLALGHARAVADAVHTSGRDIDTVHLVGGGSRNELLCQLTADACGLPVAAGPAEATALGNLLSQAITAEILPDWQAARDLVAQTHPPVRYLPTGDPAAWRNAAERIANLSERRVS